MADSIFERSKRCLELFRDCMLLPSLVKDGWAQSQLAAFFLWTASIGAFARSQGSADARLKSHPDIGLVIQSLLEALEEALQHLSSPASTDHKVGERSPASDMSATTQSDYSADVETTLGHLTTLAIAIRKAGTRHRNVRAEQFAKESPTYQSMRETTRKETASLLHSIRISGIFRESRHTGEQLVELASTDHFILDRLIECNINRWSRFIYAKHHDGHMSKVPASTKARPVVQPRTTPRVSLRPSTDPEVPSDQLQTPESPSELTETAVSTISKPSTAGTPLDREAYRKATRVATMDDSDEVGTTLAGSFVAGRIRLQYPPRPKVGSDSKHFKCSCCRQTLPIGFIERELWRQHVKTDLRPYVCLMQNCVQPYETFADTNSWLLHMEPEWKRNIVRWTCSAKHTEPPIFDSEVKFVEHLKSEHPRIVTKSQLPTIIKGSGGPTSQLFEKCPLCGWIPGINQFDRVSVPTTQAVQIRNKVMLSNHIAEHLQEIALRSLPEEIFRPRDGSIRSASTSESSTSSAESEIMISQSEIDHLRDIAHRSEEELALIEEPVRSILGANHSEDWRYDGGTPGKRHESWRHVYYGLARNQASPSELSNPFICPYLENPHFIDRPGPFRELIGTFRQHNQLEKDHMRRVALVGPKGIGKTSLAIKYAYRMKRHDPKTSVFWVSAQSDIDVHRAYVEIARSYCIQDDPDIQEGSESMGETLGDLLVVLHHWLMQEQNGRWLIVFDDFPNSDRLSNSGIFAQSLRTMIPECAHGSVLFVMENRALAEELGAQVMTVPPMTEPETLALLRDHTERLSLGLDDEHILSLAKQTQPYPSLLIRALQDYNRGSLPNSGPRKLVVAIDLGTSFSSVAWADTRRKTPLTITEWPGLLGNDDRVPTILQYEDANFSGHRAWGFDIERDSNKPTYEMFKLGLDPEREKETKLARDYPGVVRLPDNSDDVENLVVDYLTALRENFERQLANLPNSGDLQSIPQQYIITVPAMWSEKDQDRTRSCAERAGMGQKRNIGIISELEAAAIRILEEMREDGYRFKKGDTFVICDAGGGTVDVISYNFTGFDTVEGSKPVVQIEEAVPGEGYAGGGTFVNRLFAKYMRYTYGNQPGFNEEVLEDAVQEFERHIKKRFDGNTSKIFKMRVGIPDGLDITNGNLRLSGLLVKQFFDPVIGEIERLVLAQLRAIHQRVQCIFLVGGLSGNKYLRTRLEKAVGDGVKVLRPKNTLTAVVEGALIKGMRDAQSGNAQIKIDSRIARRSYGMSLWGNYVPGVHERSKRVIDSVEGKHQVQTLQWFAKQNEAVRASKLVPCYWTGKVSDGVPAEIKVAIYCFEAHSNMEPPLYPDAPGVTELGILRIKVSALSGLARAAAVRKEANVRNEEFYIVDFDIQMTLHSASLTFALLVQGTRYQELSLDLS